MSEETEVVISENRKSKNDKKAKARYNKYKRGGHNRIRKPKGL